MSMSDLLSDALTRIRNAQSAHLDYAILRSSNLIKAVLDVLKREGYILDYEEYEEKEKINVIKVDLKYHEGSPAIKSIKRISKPGLRKYGKINKLPKCLGGLGVYILSTPKGVISDFEARNQKIGGEILCEVY
jgi:small subunit ribosomal protein S8